ncbi:hypothetical protein V6N13_059264 [Hibiscus sabdariffa]
MANTTSSSFAEGMPNHSAEFRARYKMIAAKNRWEEQGFYLDDSLENYGLEPMIYSRLHELGLFRLARQPARANLNWVIEFYTNNSAGDDNVTVRGKRVAANAATINSILGLPDDDPSFYAMLSAFEEEDFEQIKDFLCEEGTAWNTTGRNPHSVSRPSLRPEAKLWNTFVKRNIMPTSHNQTVDRTRLLLIHTIIAGYRFNVGEVIANELAAACRNDKGILAFPCLITALCRRAAVPAHPGDKHTVEKPGWSKKEYMRKMDIADATPIRVAMPTPPTSPVRPAATASDQAGPSTRPVAQPSPATTPRESPVPSPTSTPTAMLASRRSKPDSPLGSAPTPPSSPPPVQSDEAVPLHILQLRSQLQRIEARQLKFQEETKVFQQTLLNFLRFQFPAASTFFTAQPEATPQANFSAATRPQQSTNPSAKTGNIKEVHFSSDDENDIFDWQTPRELQQPIRPTPKQTPTPVEVPILQPAPITAQTTSADQPIAEASPKRKGKTPAGRTITRTDPSSPKEEQAAHQPAQKRRRYHIITSDSEDEQSATIPDTSAEPSLSF